LSINNIFLLTLTVLVATTAQLLLKQGVNLVGGISFNGEIISEFIKILKSPYIMAGLLAYVCAMGLTLVVLSKVELSLFVLFANSGLVITVILAYFLFNEPITLQKIIGCILIIGGVSIIYR
jgi:multidrug transporter EmrE-like cation transporter